jgi:hypothetical protein
MTVDRGRCCSGSLHNAIALMHAYAPIDLLMDAFETRAWQSRASGPVAVGNDVMLSLSATSSSFPASYPPSLPVVWVRVDGCRHILVPLPSTLHPFPALLVLATYNENPPRRTFVPSSFSTFAKSPSLSPLQLSFTVPLNPQSPSQPPCLSLEPRPKPSGSVPPPPSVQTSEHVVPDTDSTRPMPDPTLRPTCTPPSLVLLPVPVPPS